MHGIENERPKKIFRQEMPQLKEETISVNFPDNLCTITKTFVSGSSWAVQLTPDQAIMVARSIRLKYGE